MIRALAHRFSRGVVLKRHLPREFGHAPIFVSPEAALTFWKPNLGRADPYLLSMVRELVRAGMEVWDIGANVGLFSFAAAALGARVLSVEADIWLAALLQRSVRLNRLPVTVLHVAISEATGFAPLYLSDNGRASNSLSGQGTSQTVATATLDSLLGHFPTPQLVKMDVEGTEYVALRGAAELLRRRPTILCEVTQHHDAVGTLLRDAGYTLYGALSQAKDRQPLLKRPSIETLAIPTALTAGEDGKP